MIKNRAWFSKWISEINYTYIYDTHDIDEVIAMFNLIEYRDIYSKVYGNTIKMNQSQTALTILLIFLLIIIIVFRSNVKKK